MQFNRCIFGFQHLWHKVVLNKTIHDYRRLFAKKWLKLSICVRILERNWRTPELSHRVCHSGNVPAQRMNSAQRRRGSRLADAGLCDWSVSVSLQTYAVHLWADTGILKGRTSKWWKREVRNQLTFCVLHKYFKDNFGWAVDIIEHIIYSLGIFTNVAFCKTLGVT